jgi:hypothetical protein
MNAKGFQAASHPSLGHFVDTKEYCHGPTRPLTQSRRPHRSSEVGPAQEALHGADCSRLVSRAACIYVGTNKRGRRRRPSKGIREPGRDKVLRDRFGRYTASRRLCSNSPISFASLTEVIGSDAPPDSRRHSSSFLSSCSRSRC